MLMMIGAFLTRPFVRLSLNTKIVNEVFEFEGLDGIDSSEFLDLKSEEEVEIEDFQLDSVGQTSKPNQMQPSLSWKNFDIPQH